MHSICARMSLQHAGLNAQQLCSHVAGTKGLGCPGRISLQSAKSVSSEAGLDLS